MKGIEVQIPNPAISPCAKWLAVSAFASSVALAQAPAPQAPAHVAPPIVKEGATVKVSEHVWVIPDEKASMVPNVGIIVVKDVTAFRTPTEIFEREKVLDLGGVRVRILRLGPGHTRGDTVTFVEGDRVLFSGDLAMKGLFPAFATPQSASGTWLTSLDQLDALKPRTVIGAHYPISDASVISEYREYIKSLQARVGELKREGKSSDEAAEILRAEFAKKYPDWAQPLRTHTAVTRIWKELP